MSDPAAQASAVMEAAEIAIAERVRHADAPSLPMQELAAEGLRVLPLNNLIARGEKLARRDETVAWVEGYDLLLGGTAWVPAEAVTLDPRDENGRSSRYWQSSDGLASGNILLEAVRARTLRTRRARRQHALALPLRRGSVRALHRSGVA